MITAWFNLVPRRVTLCPATLGSNPISHNGLRQELARASVTRV
jgi:hypothetical protein